MDYYRFIKNLDCKDYHEEMMDWGSYQSALVRQLIVDRSLKFRELYKIVKDNNKDNDNG